MALPARYERNVHALSEDECRLLADKRVAVLGCGGLGGYVIEILARLGAGTLRVVDGDVLEESNLNRQILATEQTLGLRKAEAAAARVARVNDRVRIEPFCENLTADNASALIAGADCAVDCLDDFAARFLLARACRESGVPVVYGAIAGWFGQVCTVYPDDASFAEVYGSVDEGAESQHVKLGNLPFTAAATASVMASETVKVLIGRGDALRNRLMMIDLLDGAVDELPLG